MTYIKRKIKHSQQPGELNPFLVLGRLSLILPGRTGKVPSRMQWVSTVLHFVKVYSEHCQIR